MTRQRSGWTIGHELTLLVLAALLPFALLGGLWAGEDYHREQARIQGRALQLARGVAGEVDQLLADTVALAEALARVPSVKRNEQPQASQLLSELAARYPYYESLFALDAAGRVFAIGGRELPPPGNRQAYVQQSLLGGGTVITNPLPARTAGRHVFVVATPVWDELGVPAGIVGISVNLLRLQDGLRRADLPEHSSLLIVDEAGIIVTRRTDPEQWIGKSALDATAVRDALRLREGVSEGDFVDGRRRLSGFAPTHRVEWEVIVGIPSEEAYGALQRELRRAVARLLAVGALAGGAAWLLSRRMTRPIRDLAGTARAYAAGDLSQRVRVDGPEELAALGTTLGRMAETLEYQMAELKAARSREREAGERALVELRRLHSEFIAVAAHELRTPVAAAKSYAELLLRDDAALAPATRRQALVRLDSVCDRLSRLVRSLLGASRIQAGELVVACVPFDLGALVARAAEEIADASASHDVVFQSRPHGLVTAVGDAERVEDVLMNLLINATKYSPPGTSVLVSVVERSTDVEVEVKDQGPGVPESERAAVFERFTRGSNVTSAGVGLGLYIARVYVESMGGTIGVRSPDGGGAAFWFRLPRMGRHSGPASWADEVARTATAPRPAAFPPTSQSHPRCTSVRAVAPDVRATQAVGEGNA